MNLQEFFSRRSTRLLVGLLLVLHGLAHIALGTAAQDDPRHSVVTATALFLVATPGFVAAGFGAWNVPGLRSIWGGLVKVSVLASLLLVAIYAPPASRAVVAIVIDAVVLALADALTVERTAWRTA